MYGTIPDVVISKPPRNNQCRVVVAMGVGVLIGALGTAAMLFPVATKITEAPTPAPRPILAATEDDPKIFRVDEKCPEKCLHYLRESKELGVYCTQGRLNLIYERCLD